MTPEISREFVARYNQPGPRYTSYPTVPAWQKPFGPDEYTAALRELAERPEDDLALYLHLPFCAKHCHYCGCNSVTKACEADVAGYLDRIEREISLVTRLIGTDRRVVQLHWGGGTPNFLTNEQIERVLGLFRSHFELAAEVELSLEIDPRIATPAQTEFLRECGFNRISLGVQDFARQVQKAIGRLQSRQRTLEVYHSCREAGFAGVNIDLVYGLPGQTRDSFTTTLDEVIGLGPDRVACFSYAHVPWVKPEQNNVDLSFMLGGYEKFQLFQLTVDRFQAADYTWIGIDHFARSGDELALALAERHLHRNFMGYATKPAPHMLAFGMSGIGDVCDRFVQNDSDLAGWSSAVDKGRLPIVKGHVLDDDDRLRRQAILNLMCNQELPWSLTEERFGAPANELLADSLEHIAPLIEDGLAEMDDQGLRITAKGRYFVRNVAMVLDAYLTGGQERPVFSRTV